MLATITYAFKYFHLLTKAILLGFDSSSPHTYTAADHNVAVIVPGGTHRLFEACTGRYVHGWHCYRCLTFKTLGGAETYTLFNLTTRGPLEQIRLSLTQNKI